MIEEFRQDIYNQVRKHLLTQKAKSVTVDEFNTKSCAYRGENGNKCAIGALIKDEDYDPRIEGKSFCVDCAPSLISYIFAKSTRYHENVVLQEAHYLRELQSIHDMKAVIDWETTLNDFASHYELKVEA